MKGKITADPRPEPEPSDAVGAGAGAGAVSGALAGSLYGALVFMPSTFGVFDGNTAALLDLGALFMAALFAALGALIGVVAGGLIGPLIGIIVFRFRLVRVAGPIGTVLGATTMSLLSMVGGPVAFTVGFAIGALSGHIGARRFSRRLETG